MSQEVKSSSSGTSQDEIVTKATYRFKVWNLLENKDLVMFPRPCKGRIPNFVDNMVAAERLAAQDIFKNAQVIKVNIDKPQELVRYNVLESGKTLLLATTRTAEGFLFNVSLPPDGDKYKLREASKQRGAFRFGKTVPLDEKIHVDMVVVGSVAVSKEGHRIGKGEGFSDLEFGMMAACGMISENTIIVTIVHDEQVFDTLPHDLFQPFDVPVDVIVTSSQVIEVEPRLPRPAGLMWHIVSDRRMQNIPVLKTLRDKEIEAGNECKLKEVDSEPEDRPRPYFLPRPRRPFIQRWPRNGYRNDGSQERPRNTRTFRRTRKLPPRTIQNGSGDDELIQDESGDRRSDVPRRNNFRRPRQNSEREPRQNGERQPRANGDRQPRQNGDRQPRENGDRQPRQNGVRQPRENGDRQPNTRRQNGERQTNGQRQNVDRQRNGQLQNRSGNRRRQTSSGDSETNGYQRQKQPRYRRPDSRNSEQNTDGENKENNQNRPQRRPGMRRYKPKPRLPTDFSVKVGNIGSTVRVRDLKAALQEKGVHPREIIWRGHRGFAFLNFAKLKDQPDQPTAVDDVIASLNDLTVKYEGDKGSQEALLSVEPAKPISRIEDAGVTAV